MQIKYDGSFIILTIPGTGDSRSHELKIPIERCGVVCSNGGAPQKNQLGWAQLLSILKARYNSEPSHQVIGTKAAPVQYDLERVRRIMRNQKASVELTLEDLGL
jgi:hypothetical protein